MAVLACAVAVAGNPAAPSLYATSTKARSTQHAALVQSSSTGTAKIARRSLLKARTGTLETTVRHDAKTVTSNPRPPGKTILIRPRSAK
ncbi:MAG: hypothetical protein ACRESY_05400 [Steroidobacteraceae bacterium]